MQEVIGGGRRAGRWLVVSAGADACRPRLRPKARPGYPSKPVRILVPYGPGGVADTTVRLLAQKLNERLGQPFIIENRPGAGGILAAKAGATAAPDGYTLALTGNGTAISKSLFKSLPYDVLRDFNSVSVMAWLDLTIATKADGPLKTVKDIVAAAKKNPGKLNFGTIAPGSTQHLSAVLFMLTGDIKVTMVTFRTTPDLVTALLRGDVDVGFDYLAGLHAQLNDQQLRAVASTGEKRSPSTPNVPTVKESGMPEYVVTSWNAVSVPAGTPDDVVNFLSKEISEALKSPDIQAKALAVRARRPRHHAGGDAGAHARRHREMGRGDREGRTGKAMTKLPLKIAIATSGHTAALKDGTVPIEGVEANFVEVVPIIAAFRRMVRDVEFDVCEMAPTTYLIARARGAPYIALPIFVMRRFHHGGFVVRPDAGIKVPKDLEGKRVGVRAYSVTTGVWTRGHFHQRIRPRRLEGDLGGGRRGARHLAQAAGQRHPCAARKIAGRA